MSVRELSERTGITISKISYIERGYILPDILQFRAMAVELGFSADYALGLIQSKK